MAHLTRGGHTPVVRRRGYARLLGAIAGVFLASSLAACASGSKGTATHTKGSSDGGTLTMVIAEYNWSSLDPAANVVSGWGVLEQIYDRLLRVSASGQLQPWLATSYTPSSDGLTWTFGLRKGVSFTDGTPFNAAAVKFNMLRQINPKNHAGEGSNLPATMTIDTPNDNTVVVHLKTPDAALPWALATTAVGLMASPTAVAKYGTQYGLHPVGTGPFELSNQVVGQTMTLTKNPHYWVPGEPKLDQVKISYIASAESAYQTLASGGAQLMDFVQPLQAKEGAGNSSLTLDIGKATGVDQMWLNTRTPPFSNINARRAVGYALDEAALSKNLFFGYYKPTESDIASGSWAYPGPTVAGYPSYNLAAAKELVKKLGGLSFTFILPNDSANQGVGAALQQQMAAAGIKMTLKPEDAITEVGDEFSGNFEASDALVPGLPDPDSYVGQFFASAKGPTGINDPQLFSLFTQARDTTDQAKRAALYKQVAERMGQLAPELMIAENPIMVLRNKSVHGVIEPPFPALYLNDATIG